MQKPLIELSECKNTLDDNEKKSNIESIEHSQKNLFDKSGPSYHMINTCRSEEINKNVGPIINSSQNLYQSHAFNQLHSSSHISQRPPFRSGHYSQINTHGSFYGQSGNR